MSFLYPAFLLGALAIAIPVALHLLRRDVAPDVPFTAVRLLQKSPVERSRRRRLRDLVLLAARVAALLLLAAAFARPYARSAQAAAAPLRIVAIDRSFSMAAPRRFERAVELARGAIDEAGFGERVAVLAFDDRADVIAAPGSTADARAAVAALKPGYGATRFAAVLAKASEIAAGAAARVIIVTDLQRAGSDGDGRLHAPAALHIETRDAGPPADNVAVTAVRLEGDAVVASVLNTSPSRRRGGVTLTHDGGVVARASYDAPAAASADVRFEWKRASDGFVTASVEDTSGPPTDNSRHALLTRRASSAVMVIGSDLAPGFFLLRALDAAGGAIEATGVTAAAVAGGRATAIGAQSAVTLLSTRNLDRAAREALTAFVRRGGGLLIAATPEVDPAVVTSLFGWNATMIELDPTRRTVTLAPTDPRHPIFRPFGGLAANLGQVTFQQTWRIAPAGWEVSALFSDGAPAVLERTEGNGRVLVFGSDVDRRWNDFPVHPSFVPFIVEAVRHVSMRQAPSGDFIVGRAPRGVPDQPGVHKTPDGRLIAVNVDPRESSAAAMTAADFTGMIDTAPAPGGGGPAVFKAEQTESRQNLWQYGLILMLATLVIESFVGKVD